MHPSKSTSPRKQPTQERSRRTVAAIVEAGAQVFERHGYALASTDRIAARAGVSVGSLYQYFPNKDAILLAVAERHIEEGKALVESLVGQALAGGVSGPEELLRIFVRAVLELHTREAQLHRVIFEEARPSSALLDRLERWEHELIDQVAAMLKLAGIELAAPRLGACLVIRTIEALVHGFVLHPPDLHPPDGVSEADFVEEVVVLIHAYLSRGGGAGSAPGARLDA